MPVYTSDRLMVGCPGVAPGYVDLESTRSHGDPHPISIFNISLLPHSVKKDTSASAQTIFGVIKSGLKILKDGFDSLRRGEGVPVDQTPVEEPEP